MLPKVAQAMIILTIVGFVGTAAQANPAKTTQSTASRVTGSVYCVHGTVTVKGWEEDLVKRNPGLRRFNWSPITAAKPGVLVFRRSGQSQSANQYHYAKPRVLSYVEMRAVQKTQEQKTQEQIAVQAQLVSTYTGASLGQSATYSSAYSASDNQRRVNGRLISTHFQ